MKVLFLSIILFCALSVNSQYYFTDIVSHQQSEQQYKLLLSEKVKQIKAVSYNAMDEITDGFTIEQTIKEGGKKIITKTILPNSGTTQLVNEYSNGKLISSVSSSIKTETTVATNTNYTYNENGLITSIYSYSSDTIASESNLTELHLWQYNKNIPTQMLKIKNGRDTMKIQFTYDEKGNVAEEKWLKGLQTIENYYYYYNEANLLTDVVRYNSRIKKLLPDFVYEYDIEGKVLKMTQSIKGGTDYLIWKYSYNAKGLKDSESCYNRQKQLAGKVVYTYSN